MDKTRLALRRDVDTELERMITALAVAQRQRREALRRKLRRHIVALLRAQGFSVGDIFPAAGRSRRGTSEANG
jgi:hypothetical protein